ncbi:hypothetical protein DL96DRAFT_1816828 [Flagelloscypha sp. PMI_526]|nr:hypothetical protein DL96DRAFT_1816828 [Flagelloscypha sp. PMI_526]
MLILIVIKVVNLLELKAETTPPQPTTSGDTAYPATNLHPTCTQHFKRRFLNLLRAPSVLKMKYHLFPNLRYTHSIPSMTVPAKPPLIKYIIFTLITSLPTPAVPDILSPYNPFNSLHFVEHPWDDIVDLLPDKSWVVIICGVNGHVYMPGLTAIADVLLGELGYGTVAEAVDASTPFVYVSRLLFIEEHGLRTYLNQAGTGIELSRDCCESGDWAWAIENTYETGRDAKLKKRQDIALNGATETKGIDTLVQTVVDWVEEQK